MRIIGVTGFIAAGKDTTADFIVGRYGYRKDSFAKPLKDACAAIFNWDREMLEGNTLESRDQRVIPDPFWSKHLNDVGCTPRKMLQLVGTEVMRNNLHPDIWILSLKKRALDMGDNVIVADCRFPNEIAAIHELGGKVIRVRRGPDPCWYEIAEKAMAPLPDDRLAFKEKYLEQKELLEELEELCVHPSEFSWIGSPIDYIIENDGTLTDLKIKVLDLMERIENETVLAQD